MKTTVTHISFTIIITLLVLSSFLSKSSHAFTPINVNRQRTTPSLLSSALQQEIENMRVKEMKQELESYGISTKAFLEKKDLIEALVDAREKGLKPKQEKTQPETNSSAYTATTPPPDTSSNPLPREERLQQEMEKCKLMKTSELKKELEDRGIATKSFFEKTEFVKALAEARVDGVTRQNSGSSTGDDEYAEYKTVEVITDDSGPRKDGGPQQASRSTPFEGFGGMGGIGNIADMFKNMGTGNGVGNSPFGGGAGGSPFGGMGGMNGVMGKAQEMMKNPKIRELMTKAQSNPRIMAKVNECMSNPAAFMKYQNDPEVAELITEFRKFM